LPTLATRAANSRIALVSCLRRARRLELPLGASGYFRWRPKGDHRYFAQSMAAFHIDAVIVMSGFDDRFARLRSLAPYQCDSGL
jgi:hypothetical protein